MSRTIRIRIPDDPDLVHRFRNFGEDVFRALRVICSVDIHEIDRSTSTFCVRKVAKADLGRVTQIIERELGRHCFDDTATVTRE